MLFCRQLPKETACIPFRQPSDLVRLKPPGFVNLGKQHAEVKIEVEH